MTKLRATCAQVRPIFKIGAEQTIDIPLNFLTGDNAAILRKQPIALGKNWSKSPARVTPFVDDLFQNAGVRMLWDKTGSQQFNALARNLFHNRRIIQEPPTSERQKTIEFSRNHTELMLILAAEHAHKKPVVRKAPAQIFQGTKICLAHTIPGQANSRIHLAANTNHQR